MNTPAHLALSVFIWRAEDKALAVAAIVFGALLPDIPMVGFYLYQKLWLSTPETVIWSTKYFQDDWQLLFDSFNSIPAAITLIAVFLAIDFKIGFLIAASALLHMLFDLPLHNDDAHRHFLPLSDWRFVSPISYWDARHFGHVIIWVELASALIMSLFVSWRGPSRPMQIIAILTLLSYVGFSVFAFKHWG